MIDQRLMKANPIDVSSIEIRPTWMDRHPKFTSPMKATEYISRVPLGNVKRVAIHKKF